MVNVFQKIILALGVIVFILAVAVYPEKYVKRSQGEAYYFPATTTHYAFIDLGTTSLRGVTILITTAALWAIAGKKKAD